MEKKEKNFEEKLDELEKIVKALEQGDIELDQAIKSFTEAITLAKECDNDLKKAEKALVNIVDESGNIKEFKDEEEK